MDSDLCEECNSGAESTRHVFWSCKLAANISGLTSIFTDSGRLYFLEFMGPFLVFGVYRGE